MCGTPLEIRSKSSIESSTRASFAIASRCSTALVDPPSAITTAIAFSNASRVRICRGRTPSARRRITVPPLARAASSRRGSVAGGDAEPGSDSPSASTAAAMVFAVYMPAHEPGPGHAVRSSSFSSSGVMDPAETLPTASNTSWIVTSRPRKEPGMIVPP